MRWLVVGAGSIGRRHLRNLTAAGERELFAMRRDGFAVEGDLRAVRVVTSYGELPADGDAIAIICTPTANHLTDALAAIAAGHHVLIEKPLADRLDKLSDLRVAAQRADRVVGVAHCFRFHALLQRIGDEVRAGRIGKVSSASVWCGQHLADWRPGRDYRETYSARGDQGGGVLLDLIHELDYADWLFGPVTDVSGTVRNTGALEIDADDVADVVLRSGSSHAPIAVHLDYLARPAVRGGRVTGERASITWDLLAGTAEVNDGRSTQPISAPAGWEREDMYRAELAAFADAVRGGARFPVGLDEGARAVRIALAARESSASGRQVAL